MTDSPVPRVRKRGDTWTLWAEMPRDRYGRRRRRTKGGFPSEEAAWQAWPQLHERWTADLAAGTADRRVAESGVTLAAYGRRWLMSVEPSLRPSTVDSYGRAVRLWERTLDVPLADLSVCDVEQWRDKLLVDMAPSHVALQMKILSVCLNHAVRRGDIAANPVRHVRAPRHERRQWRIMSLSEVGDMLRQVRRTPFWGPVLLALHTGMRRGEILGLQWPDVNLAGSQLWVRRQLDRDGRVAPPKTASSARTLWLSEPVRDMFSVVRAGSPGVWVFGRPGSDGSAPWDPHDFTRRVRRWLPPGVRFHDLRHQYATVALAAGVPPKVLQETLGHASITTTMDVYAQVWPDQAQAAAERVSDALGSDVPGRPPVYQQEQKP